MVSAIKGIEELVKICITKGVKHVVISPGSRNAPLTLTFDHYKNNIDAIVIPDERSAAFFALGLALAKQQPVALLCTSGTAAINYAPAVTEAYYQKIPLIVLTADRPLAWINQGDGQTIMQTGIYGNHVKYQTSLPVIHNTEDEWMFNRLINEAFIAATCKPLAPVHINVPMSEPLYKLIKANDYNPRNIEFVGDNTTISINDIEKLNTILENKKIVFLVGQIQEPKQLQNILETCIKAGNAVVLNESTSNIFSDNFISTIDRCIDGFSEQDKLSYAPDVLITLGDAIVSKKVKAWLRKIKLENHIHIGFEHGLTDTFTQLTMWIKAEPENILPQINFKSSSNEYNLKWDKLNTLKKEKHNKFMNNLKWCDLKVYEVLNKTIQNANLHLGNSTPVRYAQLFEWKNIKTFGNRGTSGIDGCTSTAAGFAYGNISTNYLITGDISFYYDSNALWNCYLPKNLKIILINNSGGNIFRIIDGPENDDLTVKYFETKQNYDAKNLCAQFGLAYMHVKNEKELDEVMPLYIACKQICVMEIFTDNKISPQIVKDYFKFLNE